MAACASRAGLRSTVFCPDDTAVLLNCSTGLKYPMPPVTQALDRHGEIDWAQFR